MTTFWRAILSICIASSIVRMNSGLKPNSPARATILSTISSQRRRCRIITSFSRFYPPDILGYSHSARQKREELRIYLVYFKPQALHIRFKLRYIDRLAAPPYPCEQFAQLLRRHLLGGIAQCLVRTDMALHEESVV